MHYTNEENCDPVKIQAQWLADMEEDLANGNRQRLLVNLDMYVGTEGRQWNDEAFASLTAEGKPALTYNLIQQMVDTTLGNLEQRPLDIIFESTNDTDTELVNVVQSLYEYESDRGNYENVKMKLKRDGLIHTGVLQFYIDTTDDFRGNVGVRAVHPSHVIIDPWWQSEDPEDIRRVGRAEWLTLEQIQSAYPDKKEELCLCEERYSTSDVEVKNEYLDKVADRSIEWYDQSGKRFKVIEYTYIVEKPSYKILDTYTGLEDDDKTDKIEEMLEENVRNLYLVTLGDRYEAIPYTKRVCKVATICPALDRNLVLADGDYPLQLGQVPYLIYSYKSVYGHRIGMPDLLRDAQISLNKRESMISHMLAQSGFANWLVEDGAFSETSGIDDFTERVSKGGQVFRVANDTVAQGRIQPLARPPVPQDLLMATQNTMDLMYKLSSVVPAMQGQQTASHESGKLYMEKQASAIIALDMLQKSLAHADQQFGDLFLKAVKQVYGTSLRVIVDRKNRKMIELNKLAVDSLGYVTKQNDLSKLRRIGVNVGEGRVGPGVRQIEIQKLTDLLPAISNPMMKALIELQLAKLLDLPETFLKQAESYANTFIESQKAQMEAAGKQSTMQTQQAEQQAQAPQGGGMEQVMAALGGAPK